MDIVHLGRVDYQPTYRAMQDFTARRIAAGSGNTADQLWLCEHPPVYTQGLAGKAEHIVNPGDIPVIATDRGGQVTYHGPGQVMAYPLLDLKRAGYFVKEYVFRIEEAAIKTLAHFGVTGHRVIGAPGIYIDLADPSGHAKLPAPPKESHSDPFVWLRRQGIEAGKIVALGLKVSHHHTYHGVALNVAMDLEPFSRINPCGYAKLQTVDLSTIGVSVAWDDAAAIFSNKLVTYLAP